MIGFMALSSAIVIIISLLMFLLFFRKTSKRIFIVTKNFHFSLLGIFIALLVIMTVIGEVQHPSSASTEITGKPITSSNMSEVDYTRLDDAIYNGKAPLPDSPLLLATRTHEAKEQLVIDIDNEEDFITTIYVERRDTNEQSIEEYVYRPFFIINDLDFTEQLELDLPKWDNDTVKISKMIQFDLKRIRYSDASILKQFTSEQMTDSTVHHFSSASSSPIIHLIVPHDLEIVDPFGHVVFVGE